jgi:hypothetical protein
LETFEGKSFIFGAKGARTEPFRFGLKLGGSSNTGAEGTTFKPINPYLPIPASSH